MAVDRVLIVGGGVSGLATAYHLSRYAIPCTIIEKTHRTGGLIQTDVIDGCHLEAGPDSYIATKPAVTELAEELPGLKGQIIGSNDAARRIFVVRNGKLLPMPQGMIMMVPGEWEALQQSHIVSEEAKHAIQHETKFKPLDRKEDVSVGQFVDEHFGPEVLEYLTEPLLCGVYGGDSENLSAESVLPRFVGYERKYGSLVKGVQQELRERPKGGSLFLSFRGGMQTLTNALATAIAGRVNIVRGEATAITRNGDNWQVRIGNESLSAHNLALCCPAHVNAKLLESSAQPIADELAGIPELLTLYFFCLMCKLELGFSFLALGNVPRIGYVIFQPSELDVVSNDFHVEKLAVFSPMLSFKGLCLVALQTFPMLAPTVYRKQRVDVRNRELE